MDDLGALFQFRISDVPGGTDTRDVCETRSEIATTLAGIHASMTTHPTSHPRAIGVAWFRPAPRSFVVVLAGGPNIAFEDAASSAIVLSYPPGTRAIPASPETALRGLNQFSCWVRLGALLRAEPSGADEHPQKHSGEATRWRGCLESMFLHSSASEACYLALALPLPSATITEMLGILSMEANAAAQMSAATLDDQFHAARVEARYRDLERSALDGVWAVHLFVAGRTETTAHQVAAIAASEARRWEDLPLRLAPSAVVYPSLLAALGASVTSDHIADGSPFWASCRTTASFVRPPLCEIPGVRQVRRPLFDVTPELPPYDTTARISVGDVLDEGLFPCGRFDVAPETLNRHTFVCGSTGSGKSQTVRALLTTLAESPSPIPWLVIEPAKSEYRRMGPRIAPVPVVLIRPGDPEQPVAGLNPLEPSSYADPVTGKWNGFPLQTHLDFLRALFVASFDADDPFPQVITAALTRAYERLGWDLSTGRSTLRGRTLLGDPVRPRYPRLGDIVDAALEIVDELPYGDRLKGDVKGFVQVRIASLRYGTTGRFLDGAHPLDLTRLLANNVVLELEGIGDDQDKAFLIGAVVVRLVEFLRLRGATTKLEHLTVIEEAHRLLRRPREGSPSDHAVALFADLLAEIRAYGEGVLVAEQIPTKLIPDVIKNTALKIVHRLPAADDRALVGSTMNMDTDQSAFVVSLRPGSAAMMAEGMNRPLLVRVDNRREADETTLTGASDPMPPVSSARASCSIQCQERPCTLREVADAAELLSSVAWLAPWVELTLLAHVAGETMPPLCLRLRPEVASRLDDARITACAISQAASAAVQNRYQLLSASYQPEELEAHITYGCTAQVAGSTLPCSREPVWFAGSFRWRDVIEALDGLPGDHALPKESTDWHERGLFLANTVADAYLDIKRSTPLVSTDELILGLKRPGPFEALVGSGPAAESIHARLTEGFREAGDFVAWPWLRQLLRRHVESQR